MGVYILQRVHAVANRFTFESLADITLQWMNTKQLLDNPSLENLITWNHHSIDAMIQVVSRSAIAQFVYPRIAPLLAVMAVMNVTIGVIHLSRGFAQRFKTTEKPAHNSPTWRNIAANIHKGFTCLLVAGYDFGIGFALTQKYTVLGVAIALALLPQHAYQWHQRVFQKTDAPDHPTLVKTCYIYSIAKRITLEMMPNVSVAPPGTSFFEQGALRIFNLLFVSNGAKPDFGL